MSVAVIIPCYNNQDTVLSAAISALEQSQVTPEIVVVDDGSNDESVRALDPIAHRIRLIQQENLGACVARNRGIKESSAPYLKFLDADDVLEPNCLSGQLKHASALSSDTIVFGIGVWTSPEGESIRRYPETTFVNGTSLTVLDLIDGSPLTSCPLHRRDLLHKVGGFNPRCPRGQEHDLHIRLALSGANFVFFDTLCYKYMQYSGGRRISDKQKTRSVCATQIEVYLEQFELAKRSRLLDAERKKIDLAFSRHFWRHGRVCSRYRFDDLAMRCFVISNAISKRPGKGAVGSWPYRFLAQSLGGAETEKLVRRSKLSLGLYKSK